MFLMFWKLRSCINLLAGRLFRPFFKYEIIVYSPAMVFFFFFREKRLTPVDVAKRIIAALKKSKKQKPSVTAFIEYYEELIMQVRFFSILSTSKFQVLI